MKLFVATTLAFAILGGVTRPSLAAPKTQDVIYKDGTVELEGYLAKPQAKGKHPVVLIVHAWKGLDDYTKRRAREVADLGYVAFAIDMYGKGVRAKTSDEAKVLSGKFYQDRAMLRRRAAAAISFIGKDGDVDMSKMGIMGYCFGGTVALEVARAGTPLRGTVTFHGGLASPLQDEDRQIKGRVLVLHGAQDPNVPPADVNAFTEAMNKAGVDWQMVAYGGAVHSFTDPGAGDNVASGAAYNKKADERSWAEMKNFWRQVF